MYIALLFGGTGVCSSGVERSAAVRVVIGSNPVRPFFQHDTINARVSDLRLDHQQPHGAS